MTPVRQETSVRRTVSLYIGDLHAANEPTLIKTLLGSCIAVCLWDPQTQVGGMNHFMLPRSAAVADGEASRFGVHAMDLLIGELHKKGADRRRFSAKVFGGGHVLGVPEAEDSVPRQNIAFIRQFLQDEGFTVVAEDIGGRDARHVHFETHTGRAWVKRIPSEQAGSRLARRERSTQPAAAFGDVTLFDA